MDKGLRVSELQLELTLTRTKISNAKISMLSNPSPYIRQAQEEDLKKLREREKALVDELASFGERA